MSSTETIVSLKLDDNNWHTSLADPTLIFVIKPGAGTFYNKFAYQNLEKTHQLVYFANSGGTYDKYPDNWPDNKSVSTEGLHLGAIVNKLINYTKTTGQIPSLIITGSRGAQVTLGKIWENYWRGPSLIINAGCLTTQTVIPKQVTPYFVTMGNDYFQSVNNIPNTTALFRSLAETEQQQATLIHLPDEGHMPNLNQNNLLVHLVNYIEKKQPISVTNQNLEITHI